MRFALNWRKSSLLFLTLFLSGCAMVGPDFSRPSAPLPDSWATVAEESVNTASQQHEEWWTTFNDPILDTLIAKAYSQNFDLQIAGLRILEARAQLGIATGNLYPQQQSLGAGLGATSASDNAANTISGDLSYSESSVGFDAAWELDLWGKFRRGVQSADARLLASIADYDSFLVTLTGEVARSYLLVRTSEERINFAQTNVATQQRSLEIVDARFEGGLVTELDVQQARNLLATTQAVIPTLKTSLQRAKNSLGILLGLPSQHVDELLSGPGVIPSAPAAVAVGIPAELLRRRPDVRQAELQAEAQSSLIGVAKADLFPHFTLLGSIGLRASDSSLTRTGGSDLGDLFDGDSVEYFGGPAISWDIFNYGRIKNEVRVQDARLQQLLINYQNTVLRAARDVEDALVGLTNDRQQLIFLQQATDSSIRSVELSLLQYREGLVDFQRVLDSQRRLALDQDTLTETRGSLALNMVGVYKALGGGWQIREGQPFVPEQTRQQMAQRTDWGGILEESPTSTEERSTSTTVRTPDW
jgi:NodT family efflux transporter outer membrane factor (OMF) lipoprotein